MKKNDKIIEPISYGDEIENDILSYSLSSIVRAIPDVRDGLKPVHRRILYVMETEHNTFDKSYRKTIKTVGSTLSRFHPHGDSSVYDAMVRMAQDFKMRVPLIDGHGNYGSIDGDGAAASRYCVTGNTMILTDKGLVRMDTIVPNSKLNSDYDIKIKVKSIDGKINTASKFFNSGKHPVYKVTLENGMSIVGTSNHPLRIFNKDEYEEWKVISKLKINDKCLIDKSNCINSNYLDKISVLRHIKDYINSNNFYTGDIYIEPGMGKYFPGSERLLIGDLKRLYPNVDVAKMVYEYCDYTLEEIEQYIENMYCSKIKNIEPVGEQTVYSIRVDSACHSFVGNGFINHNTEARLTKEAELLLEDLDKGLVPMVDNFDGLEQEPTVLPARIPNLYINGSSGIAVGIATNIPTHNPSEIIDAIVYYIDHKKTKLDKLLEIMPGPDFPTGGIIINKSELRNLYETGLGKVITRAKLLYKSNKTGKDSIIISEIPYSYAGNKSRLIEVISDCIIDKTLSEISEVRDESNKDGIQINLILKKELSKPELDHLYSKLYKFTPLQVSDTYNFMITDNLKPRVVNLIDYIKIFYAFQQDLTIKKYKYLISKYESRLEILDGLMKAIDLIDVIIEIARYSNSNQAIKSCLMNGDISGITFKTKSYEAKAKKLKFSERQALAIMSIKLQDLSGLEILSLNNEHADLINKIASCADIISNQNKLDSEIKKYLNQNKKELARPRLTVITDKKLDTYKEQKNIENITLGIDKFNYIKIVNKSAEMDTKGLKMTYLESNTDDKLIIFATDGNMYSFKIQDILKSKNLSARGILLDSLLKTKTSAELEPLLVTVETKLKDAKMLFVSTDAYIKTCLADEFIASKTVLKATVLNPGESLKGVYLVTNNKSSLWMESFSGKTSSKKISEIQTYKKTSRGVVGLKLKKDDKLLKIEIK